MKYYSLKHSVKLKEVGSFPQGGTLADSLTLERIRKLPMLSKSNEVIQFDIILNDKAKLTDYVNQGAFYHPGLMVSSRVYQNTEHLNYYEYQMYNASISLKGILTKDYRFIRPTFNDLNCIDFKKSELFFYNPLQCIGDLILEQDKVYISNYSLDYIDEFMKKNELHVIGSNVLVFNNLYIDRDVFYLKYFYHNKFLISERFSDVILNNKLTGFEIRELPFEVKFE